MVLGFEAFPRSVQPVLDRWTRGELSVEDFLKQSRWDEVWRFDAELYLPLFHFARMHRIPIRALNVERSLLHKAREKGWRSMSLLERKGIGIPKAPSEPYRKILSDVFLQHQDDKESSETAETLSEEDQERLDGFVETQILWDRAMAEGIAHVRKAGGDPLVVAIIGRGHLEYGHGVAHQLADLGIANPATLLPWDTALPCDKLVSDTGTPVADGVFGLEAPKALPEPPRPLLGVRIENSEIDGTKGALVSQVVDGSIAESAGLQKGDLIIEAAGRTIIETASLVKTIRRQAPGTWLPLAILREGNRQNIIAKFPAQQVPHIPQ